MESKEGNVKKEFVEAYKRHKGGLKKKLRKSHRTAAPESWKDSADNGADPDCDSLAAANEAMGEDSSVVMSS